MARVTLALDGRTRRAGLTTRLALAYARRRYGKDMDTAAALSHHPGVFFPWAVMESLGERRRTRLPGHLAELVQLVTAVQLGCSWCVDFGAGEWERKGLDPALLAEAVSWRSSSAFDADTRAAFAYAELVTGDLDAVDDDITADLRARFGEDGLVELTFLVALENLRSRFNHALGLTSQGFSSGEACSLAERQWAARAAARA